MDSRPVTVALSGDVMTGRGIDQILPYPGDSRLWESHVADARDYVRLAERAAGPIGRPVDFAWPWGDALRLLDEAAPDVRLFNLETSVTASDDVAADKAVHYRMSPANAACVGVARPDVCALANNHVLDFGGRGLVQTLDTLSALGIRPVGAGRDATEAARPAAATVAGERRVWTFSFGSGSSGIPRTWAAGRDSPGIELLRDLAGDTATAIAHRVRSVKRPGDLAIVSLHWGSNWGYHVPAEQVRFARGLIDGGVDLVHGHSSHHPRPIEIYRGKLILYGCGDLLNDYEGISGVERYRDDLRVLYLASLAPEDGTLTRLRMAPLQTHRMRLRRAASEDAAFLQRLFDRIDRHAPRIESDDEDMLCIRP